VSLRSASALQGLFQALASPPQDRTKSAHIHPGAKAGNVPEHQELEAAVVRVGEIVEAEVVLSLGAVDARPHL
jgi:hypothetical protein